MRCWSVDGATLVYTQRCQEAFKDVPVGIERDVGVTGLLA